MIGFKNITTFEAYIKNIALRNVESGFKRFAKQHYDECELAYDDFTNSFKLVYKGYTIPRHFSRKTEFHRVEEMTFRRVMTEE
mgnify:FL=1|jgi:hypothetical protein|nr:MAG TPA: hypothetical protein [Caudoviricetes sp.]DAV91348.1 MAG TPA: hypothetical protein [Caudoviricetes sp.]